MAHERHGVSNLRQLICLFNEQLVQSNHKVNIKALLPPVRRNRPWAMDSPHKSSNPEKASSSWRHHANSQNAIINENTHETVVCYSVIILVLGTTELKFNSMFLIMTFALIPCRGNHALRSTILSIAFAIDWVSGNDVTIGQFRVIIGDIPILVNAQTSYHNRV